MCLLGQKMLDGKCSGCVMKNADVCSLELKTMASTCWSVFGFRKMLVEIVGASEGREEAAFICHTNITAYQSNIPER